jgi:putative PIN family toxin of toxin-antitoxin system
VKVVLDSNTLLVAIGKRSRYRPIWEAFINGKYNLVLSEEILHEYEEILLEHAATNAASVVIDIFLESPDIIFQHLYYYWNAIKQDADDNKFFDIAVAANADYLVTDDAHFDEAKMLSFPYINIISSNQFLEIVQNL